MSRLLRFSTSAELVCVPAEAVVYITADGNYSSIFTIDGEAHVLTIQLGQIEKRIAEMVDASDCSFIRIGKSLIINREYITFINVPRQRLVLSDCKTFRHELSASREALKALKEFIEKEATNE